MAVVVVKSLDGQSVEEYAVQTLRALGHRQEGSGQRAAAALVHHRSAGAPGGRLRPREHPARRQGGAIIDTYVIPRFKAGQFDEGVLAGVDAIVRTLGNQPVPLASPRSQAYDSAADRGGVFGIGIGSFVLGLLGATTVGIGSLTGLRRWRRVRRRRCPQCRTTMSRLDEDRGRCQPGGGAAGGRTGRQRRLRRVGMPLLLPTASRCATRSGCPPTASARSA